MKPIDLNLIRVTLALIWLVTGALSLGIFPVRDSLALLARVGLHNTVAAVALYGSAVLDILLGILTLLRPTRRLWQAQAALIVSYSLIIAVYLPDYWLHPFAPILKNLPILLLLWLLVQYEERST
ncbi:MAG: DoxX-like family protein [Gallionella sp.]|nr:DoxX-like family protein [Gallionella sp.]MDD4959360.1 DoxX-like family protein [Gallionella sp.]